ncbi:MAG TPA: glycosyltransferase [Candidatus Binataceae bacterium]|nr:glycosyltransferase [Candidatus Binataceae bacterium]
MRILFIAAKPPDPPLRGYQLRAHHQLRLLGRRHRVTLLCFGGSKDAPADDVAAAPLCEETIVVPYRAAGMAAGLCGVLAGRPLQTAMYETPAMRRAVGRLLAERRHDLVHVQLARMAGCVEETAGLPRVIDLVDALSLNFQRRSGYDRAPFGIAARLEARRLRRYERKICRTWDHATVVSPVDRGAIGDFANLTVNRSGIELDDCGWRTGERDPHTIVFTGNLGYFSNADAICWFVREIFPLITREEPRARLLVVGARAGRKVRGLAARDRRIVVEGFVQRPQAYLERCGLAIAPMRAGSGQLFKVMEAMACGAPLVATRLAAAGIAAESERHFLAAETPPVFARQVLRLMREPALGSRLGAEARRLLAARYGWEQSVSELEEIYRAVIERRCGRAANQAPSQAGDFDDTWPDNLPADFSG